MFEINLLFFFFDQIYYNLFVTNGNVFEMVTFAKIMDFHMLADWLELMIDKSEAIHCANIIAHLPYACVKPHWLMLLWFIHKINLNCLDGWANVCLTRIQLKSMHFSLRFRFHSSANVNGNANEQLIFIHSNEQFNLQMDWNSVSVATI